MYGNLAYLIFGILGIWLGAGQVIDASIRVAKKLNINEAFIGLTILSIGTSLPEIATHITSSVFILKGIDASGVSVGTNIGSNLVQITLITGLIALLTRIKAKDKDLKRDYLVMLGSIVLLFFFSINGYISRIEGTILWVLYIIFLLYLFKKERVRVKKHNAHKDKEEVALFTYGKFIVGFILLIFCADLVVDNALILSDMWHVTNSFIGAILIGFGTAIPEFTTAVRAIMKGSTGMSLGTLIGSNITNPLFALGIGAMISGYTVDLDILYIDLPIWFIASVIGYFLFRKNLILNRKDGLILIGCYLAYLFIRINSAF